jgi:hypothetical protein
VSAIWRCEAKKNCGADRLIGLPVRASRAFMPRSSLPEQTRTKAIRSRWFGSMLAWILKTKAVIFGSVASTVRVSATCARGCGANSPSASIRSRTPKFLQRRAEIDRRQVAFTKASRSNGLHASAASDVSSMKVSRSFSGNSPATLSDCGPLTGVSAVWACPTAAIADLAR